MCNGPIIPDDLYDFSIKMLEELDKTICERCELPSVYLLLKEDTDQYLCKNHLYKILFREESLK